MFAHVVERVNLFVSHLTSMALVGRRSNNMSVRYLSFNLTVLKFYFCVVSSKCWSRKVSKF